MMRDRGFDFWGFDDYATMDLIKLFGRTKADLM